MGPRLVLLAALLLAAPTVARAQRGPAASEMGRRERALRALVAETPSGTARDARIAEMLSSWVDYDAMATRIAGASWAGGDQAQRSAFIAALRAYVVRRYATRAPDIVDYRVSVEREDGGAEPVVHVLARSVPHPREEPWEIACRLHRVGGELRVIDVETNGTSLVTFLSRRLGARLERGEWDAAAGLLRGHE